MSILPKSICNIGRFTCDMLNFINFMYKFICNMLYSICAMFSLIHKCPISLMIYPLPYVACLTQSMMCLKIHVVCFNSFNTWAKIALSVSMFCCMQLAISYRQIHVLHAWYGHFHLLTLNIEIKDLRSKNTLDYDNKYTQQRYMATQSQWKDSNVSNIKTQTQIKVIL